MKPLSMPEALKLPASGSFSFVTESGVQSTAIVPRAAFPGERIIVNACFVEPMAFPDNWLLVKHAA